jgi:hypothetical protein
MTVLGITILTVLAADQGIKAVLRHLVIDDRVLLGASGPICMVPGRIWLSRLAGRGGCAMLCAIWMIAAIPLVVGTVSGLIGPIAAGLLLGGSVSHAIESAFRGWVTDYMRIGGTSFDCADLLMALGALGVATDLVAVGYRQLS